jgi:hypothetical protein
LSRSSYFAVRAPGLVVRIANTDLKPCAIEALGRMSNPDAIPLLEEILSQSDAEAPEESGGDNPALHLTCMVGGHCHSLPDAANEALERLR